MPTAGAKSRGRAAGDDLRRTAAAALLLAVVPGASAGFPDFPFPPGCCSDAAAGIVLASLALPFGFLIARRVMSSVPSRPGWGAGDRPCRGLMIDIHAASATRGWPLVVYLRAALLVLRLIDGADRPVCFLALGVTLAAGLLTKSLFPQALPAVLGVRIWASWKAQAGRIRWLSACVLG